jgi:hypothetical protein
MECNCCGAPAVLSRMYEDFCQFCWDYLCHELKISLDYIAIGRYSGPNFGMTYYTGESTLGYTSYVSRTQQEAINESLRIAIRNKWVLLRLDIQAGSEKRLRQPSCTNIYVSGDYSKYMKYSELKPLPYDSTKYGQINPKVFYDYLTLTAKPELNVRHK